MAEEKKRFKIQKDKVTYKATVIVAIAIVASVCIVLRAAYVIFVEGEKWEAKIAKLKIENRAIPAVRGNIYAKDGRLMASSLPQYYVYVDFRADGLKIDTLNKYLPALSDSLALYFGEYTPEGYRRHIMTGYKKQTRDYQLIRRKVSYTEMKQIRSFPFFKMGPNRSGIIFSAQAQRKKPFGSLASRTIGDVYGDLDKGGKNGLELQFDSLLKGTPGIGTREKISGRYVTVTNVAPENGADITSTIDIDIQDIAQTALLDKLKEVNAESGTAIVMEVKTGAVRAITNLGKMSNGDYGETQNYAVADQSEPGSTFKIASMIVALDNGLISPSDSVDVGTGVYMYKGNRMTDHNHDKGGYGKITAAQSIWFSSNIGIAKIILNGYENNPSAYVEELYRMGFNKQLQMDIPGAGKPIVRHPQHNKDTWWKTTLPWMSFGYETQIPPIYTLNFFNAIANKGKLMKPYFVENIKRDGEIIMKGEPEVVLSNIFKKSSTMHSIRQILVDVVEHGTGTPVKSDKLKLAGKTGTAQLSQGAAGYKAGRTQHQVSFCGYFPADNPQYSCIVVVRAPRTYPSGGGISGVVFKNIAERTFAKSAENSMSDVKRDSSAFMLPVIHNGRYEDIRYLLDKMSVHYEDRNKDWDWVTTRIEDNKLVLH